MTRQQLEAIGAGQTGLYSWNPAAPVVSIYPMQSDRRGRAFRYVIVQSATGNGTIGFVVSEDFIPGFHDEPSVKTTADGRLDY